MKEYLQFASREDFRAWLSENCQSGGGVWVLFGKGGGPLTMKACERSIEIQHFRPCKIQRFRPFRIQHYATLVFVRDYELLCC